MRPFVCRAVRAVAPDMTTVVLAPATAAVPRFEAGQFVTVEFDVDGQTAGRCYTISSPPTRPDRIALTVKRTPDGAVSRWLHDGGLAPGDAVRVGAPQGAFTMAGHPAPAYLLLTAGSGITPALSMLRDRYDLAADCDVVLVHSHRAPDDVPYRSELDTIARHTPGIRVHYLRSQGPVPRRLTAPMLSSLVPDAAAREVLVCGPSGYRSAARSAVAELGVAANHCHEESFTVDVPEPAHSDDATFRVEFRDHGVTVDCPAGTTVLAAAMRAGVPWPASCAQGLCGTCKGVLLAGRVDLQHNGGIRPREIAAGKLLLCCSRPLTDLVIGS